MKKAVLFALFAYIVLFFQGCISDASEDPDTKLPWNKPAAWEGKQLGVPM